jgi:lipase chaperone LimK
MQRKIMTILGGGCLLAIIVFWALLSQIDTKDTYTVTLLPKEPVIEYDPGIDARVFLNLLKTTIVEDHSPGAKEEAAAPENSYIIDDEITPYTLSYFKSLEYHFQESQNFDDHVQSVCDLIRKQNTDRDAEILCDLYKRYIELEIQIGQAQEFAHPPETPALALEFLKELQVKRREFFGTEMADALFGAEIKSQEYLIRRFAIRSHPHLYGQEKESLINELDREMWGESAPLIDAEGPVSDPYSRYQEKLVLYQKDLSEMNPAVREDFIEHVRQEFFPPDVLERIRETERAEADENERENEYRRRESRIMNDPSIPEREKEIMLIDLLFDIFGKEGDAFLRREAIRKAEKSFGEIEQSKDSEENEIRFPVY